MATPLPRTEDLALAAKLSAKLAGAYPDLQVFGDLLEGLVSVETDGQAFSTHPLFRRSDCRYCGRLANADPQTLHKHCSPIAGIVHQIDVTGAPIAGVYVAAAQYVSPLAVGGARPRLRVRTCTGRGLTAQQAEESCIGEAIERYSLVFRGDERLVRGVCEEVGGVAPNEILCVSERQFETREEWNRKADERFWVPERFDEKRPIDWIEARDLVSGEGVLTPAACSLMWYRPQDGGQSSLAMADTIGCASWMDWEGALLGALLELVERDALAIWWYNRLRRPEVQIGSFGYGPLEEIQKGLAELGRDLFILDITTDSGIPTYVAIAALKDGSEPLFSSAADFSPRSAAMRAASEIMQFWFVAVHKKVMDSEIHKWISTATLDGEAYLRPLSSEEAPPPEPSNLDKALKLADCVQRLTKAGLRPLALDLSRADTALKTARAIVPGMRHIWNRRGPGRLYDVPVRMGWRTTPLAEEDLNSICCMI